MEKLGIFCLFIAIMGVTMMKSTMTPAQQLEEPELVFGVVADIQYCDSDPHGERYFRQSLEKLSEAVACFQREQPDFVVQLGDFIDREFVSFAPVAEIWNRLDMPAYHVLGNHDFLVKPEEKTKILPLLNLERGYYDFSYASWRFIVLDGNDLSFYAPPESSERYAQAKQLFTRIESEHRPNAQTWNGGISHQQLEWLQQKLEHAFARGEEVIVFCHFPVLPLDIHTLWNDRDVIALLERYPAVKAYINGHNHAGNYIEQQGIHYLNIHGMAETEESNAFAIVEIYSDHLRVIGTGREPTRILPINR